MNRKLSAWWLLPCVIVAAALFYSDWASHRQAREDMHTLKTVVADLGTDFRDVKVLYRTSYTAILAGKVAKAADREKLQNAVRSRMGPEGIRRIEMNVKVETNETQPS